MRNAIEVFMVEYMESVIMTSKVSSVVIVIVQGLIVTSYMVINH